MARWIVSLLLIILTGCSTNIYTPPTTHSAIEPPLEYSQAKLHWQSFRNLVKFHIQDWIVAGEGPVFTLIYSEPPPAFTLDEYKALIAESFRGFKQLRIETRRLGYNGEVSDLVIQLDYSFAEKQAESYLEYDLQVLSKKIYGTTIGARLLWLNDLLATPPLHLTPNEVAISAYDIQQWLFENNELQFISPETGHIGTFNMLLGKGTTRYLSVDNSLVLLIIDKGKTLGFDAIREIRKYSIDSDYFLGGVIAKKENKVALLGRKRQVSLIDFPALRVEDVMNAMLTDDKSWAQSYDRTTPGAGRVNLDDMTEGDWAPSYLSPGLIDTEFGSLLNISDAMLKSQSLSGTVKYKGFEFTDFDEPPYPEGVFTKLFNQLEINSLVFNFNTLGTGHWLDAKNDYAIYALNSSGSFNVTYSPNDKGQNSTSEEAAIVNSAEKLYTEWFRKQRSPELVRTVQYMGIYQLFGAESVEGPVLYADRSSTFKKIGDGLKNAVTQQLTECVDKIELEETELLKAIYQGQKIFASLMQYPTNLPPQTNSITELKETVTNAATAIRYEANIWGDRFEVLRNKYSTSFKQYSEFLSLWKDRIREYETEHQKFLDKYKPFESGREKVKAKDGKYSEMIHYEVPEDKSFMFEREKSSLNQKYTKIEPAINYLDKLATDIQKAEVAFDTLYSKYGSQDLLLNSVAFVCNAFSGEDYNKGIFSKFEKYTDVSNIRDSKSAITTPTIVVSRGSGGGVGGHNIAIQNFRIKFENSIAPGSFKYDGGILSINVIDATSLTELSTDFAKVIEADPSTQNKVFASTIKNSQNFNVPRNKALNITDGLSNIGLQNKAPIESSNILQVYQATERTSHDLIFGRNASTGRLFFEIGTTNGNISRVDIFGSSLTPEIISNHTTTHLNKRTARVLLDDSLSKADIESLVANYKQAPDLITSTGRTTSSRAIWNINVNAEITSDIAQPPRMVVFDQLGNNERRVVFSTNEGKVEIYAPKTLEAEQLLKNLEQEIENGATLALDKTKVITAVDDIKHLATAFKIHQKNSLEGNLLVESNTTAKIPSRIIQRVRDIISNGFSKLKTNGKNNSSFGDYFLLVKKDLEKMDAGWNIVSKVEIKDGRLRFVINIIEFHESLVKAG